MCTDKWWLYAIKKEQLEKRLQWNVENINCYDN